MKLVVTGATGYVGQRLVRRALAAGHTVVAATRRAPEPAVAWTPFDLMEPGTLAPLEGADAILHLAAATGDAAVDEAAELRAALALLDAARGASARLVFVSSQTARADAPTPYGRSKWRIEQALLPAGAAVVRPGQVYGGPARGLFGTLVQAVRRLPVLPAFLPAPTVQPVHVDDLAEALLRCAADASLAGRVLCIGEPGPVSFTRFLQAIARGRLHRSRPLLPVPAALVRLAARVLPAPPLQRLASLFELRPMPRAAEDLERLGLTLRPLASGMAASGSDRRRHLLLEARAMLHYVLRQRPAPALLRRHVRCVEALHGGAPLGLAGAALCALGVGVREGQEAGVELRPRLDAAVAIAEASPQGAPRFLPTHGSAGPVRAVLRMARGTLFEAAVRLLRALAGPAAARRRTP